MTLLLSQRDGPQRSLLHVLQVLHQSIQRDVARFTSTSHALDRTRSETRYNVHAVKSEDRSYFLHERAVEASREIAQAHVSHSVH